MALFTQHMIDEHGKSYASLERMQWLVRADEEGADQTDKGTEDQEEGNEGMEEKEGEHAEKLVDHVYVKQPEPPADYTDYARIIEEALLGEKNKVLSLEKINDFVEGHPNADVKRHGCQMAMA